MRKLALAAAFTAAAASTAFACIWDDDTLRTEIEGLPEVAQVIAGSFERNPPLYFELRLAKSEERVEADPFDFAAYDNAGVACDRLGRGDEAIAWMERKGKALDEAAKGGGDGPGADVSEHRYRLLANLGTFRAHNWLKSGASRDRIAEMEQAADEIRAAIELNPDAHFGREHYQLRAMEWLIAGKPFRAKDERGYVQGLGDFLGLSGKHHVATKDHGQLEKLGMKDAVSGLSGMVVLGAAWESVDVFHALQLALQAEGRSSVAFLANLRVRELIADGRGSLQPESPTGEDLVKVLPAIHVVREKRQAELRKVYANARKKSDAWQERRTAFMLERLREGRHPDWDETFWDGFRR